jgi:ribonuclease P protein component
LLAGGGTDPGRSRRGRERLPRAARVRKRTDYLAIQNEGRRLTGTHYLLFTRPGRAGATATRFGLTVSRKVGGSVQRNKVKRWLRESYRRLKDDFPAGVEIVVVARPSAAGAGYEPTARELATLARRLRGR